MMRMVELIEKKRNGFSLSGDEIRFIINGYVKGTIPDYQVAALAMAIYYKGMDSTETAELTSAIVESGEQIDLSPLGKLTVDKHSSGGVGDKTTLIVAPLVASCDLPVAKMSVRGLGHTGGTIDKLSSIPEIKLEMDQEAFISQVKRVGLAIISQTADLVPADKKLYALRDVTATVDSLPLIASSIMSKKIASGANGIVLDVKYGSGAFMSSQKEAEQLAKIMVAIGRSFDRQTIAVISNMDQPLGHAVGNSLEVLEAIDCLQGNGPADLMELCYELASWMLIVGQKVNSVSEARQILDKSLQSGRAWEKFLEFVSAQGGDVQKLLNKDLILSPLKVDYNSAQEGYVHKIDARTIAKCAMLLGAGRETKESEIDLGAGLYLLRKSGDFVKKGEPLICLYTSQSEKLDLALQLLPEGIIIKDHPPALSPVVSSVVR
ncbi:MAG: pyrimidine-nucleoside phosphorylase [Peptococcaceae bacterium]|nr:pyrimidine-nucleoside phosphorylase [Peptococcaceae bacterium]